MRSPRIGEAGVPDLSAVDLTSRAAAEALRRDAAGEAMEAARRAMNSPILRADARAKAKQEHARLFSAWIAAGSTAASLGLRAKQAAERERVAQEEASKAAELDRRFTEARDALDAAGALEGHEELQPDGSIRMIEPRQPVNLVDAEAMLKTRDRKEQDALLRGRSEEGRDFTRERDDARRADAIARDERREKSRSLHRDRVEKFTLDRDAMRAAGKPDTEIRKAFRDRVADLEDTRDAALAEYKTLKALAARKEIAEDDPDLMAAWGLYAKARDAAEEAKGKAEAPPMAAAKPWADDPVYKALSPAGKAAWDAEQAAK